MLPPSHRMRRSADFTSAVRAERRARGRCLVLHQQLDVTSQSASSRSDSPPLVGLVVSKSVGNSVVRHRVSRRLRAQLALRLPSLPPASRTVVRALPGAATADSAALGADLDRVLARIGGTR